MWGGVPNLPLPHSAARPLAASGQQVPLAASRLGRSVWSYSPLVSPLWDWWLTSLGSAKLLTKWGTWVSEANRKQAVGRPEGQATEESAEFARLCTPSLYARLPGLVYLRPSSSADWGGLHPRRLHRPQLDYRGGRQRAKQ